MSDRIKKAENGLLTFPLGKDEAGETVFCNLERMPHLLVAVQDPADKREFLCGMLDEFCQATPEEVRFLLVDSMRGEFSSFARDPYLLVPAVQDDPTKAVSHLNWLTVEMQRRFQLFQEAGVRDLIRYNEAKPDEILSRIVVVVAELGELTVARRDEAETALCRLAQMGRAAGIHLVLATAYPGAQVLTGLIRANIPSRISFALRTANESRWILDASGAEKLTEKGKLLYLPLAARTPVKIDFNSKR